MSLSVTTALLYHILLLLGARLTADSRRTNSANGIEIPAVEALGALHGRRNPVPEPVDRGWKVPTETNR